MLPMGWRTARLLVDEASGNLCRGASGQAVPSADLMLA